MLSLPRDNQKLMRQVDSALQLYPGDTALVRTRSYIMSQGGQPITKQSTDPQKVAAANAEAQLGTAAFSRRDFKAAARHFIRATELNPVDVSHIENTGMSYYSMQDYATAIPFFNKVVDSKVFNTGKSE